MIYIYVNSLRMAYLQRLLKAKTLEDVSLLQRGDTIILPILNQRERKIPLRKGKLTLSALKGYRIFMPFPYEFISEHNEVYYYLRDEKVKERNASLTAMGMLSFLGTIPITFHQNDFDVIGIGYCGSKITSLLQTLGCKVKMISHSRREDSISYDHYHEIKKADIIINTAPIWLFEKDDFYDTRAIIDLSSEKCVKCVQSDVEILYPGSLPEKYFPYASAAVIYDYIMEVLNEK